ncbi:MAG TPA: sulfurtransferase [Thermoleophilaceae bacterium]|nr:sulfurtransferase [Thermoleophilaceae bacterium]
MSFGPIVDAGWLQRELGQPGLRVVDCRWKLGEPGAGRAAFVAGHIPGAAFLDLDTDLSDPPGPRGRHPLPDAERFERVARAAGISTGSRVVAYDEAGDGGAARLWWLLRHFGHEAVAVLDGGAAAWRAAGGEMAPGDEHVDAGDFVAKPRADDTADAAELERDPPPLVDARAPERFAGRSEPIDPVAGHIPGAANLPSSELAPGGRYLPPAELRERLERAGAGEGREIVAYCGSGVSACTVVLAAELAGLPARLYPGSWSEWCARGGAAETGAA